MYKLNGKTLRAGKGFEHDGITYPANWLAKASQAEKDAIGVVWETPAPRADDRFYWNGDINLPKALEDKEEVDEDGNPLFVKVLDNSDPLNPVMVDSEERLVTKGLKSNYIAQVKQTAGSLLAQTDWFVVRAAEGIKDAPADVLAKRSAIRAESDRMEAAITASTSIEELQAALASANWGE